MIGANAAHPKHIINAIHPIKKMYCILLSDHFKLLTFKANIGNLETNKPLKITINKTISQGNSIILSEKA